jgi:pyruvate dehydrogenase E1 component alpha subunit
MPGVIADGNDPFAMLGAAREAAERARGGGGPTLIEAKTYRHRGHYEGDMGSYRPPEELEAWLARDPIITWGKRLVEEAGIAQPALDEIAAAVEERLEQASTFADASPHPEPEEALEHVYVEDYEGMALR